jgi:hypothetical protein
MLTGTGIGIPDDQRCSPVLLRNTALKHREVLRPLLAKLPHHQQAHARQLAGAVLDADSKTAKTLSTRSQMTAKERLSK